MRLEFEASTLTPTDIDTQTAADPSQAVDVSAALQKGIAAAQRGDRASARTLLTQVCEADANNVDAWMWLASISEYPEELMVFLNNVLKIDPENARALEWHNSTRNLVAKTFVQRGIAANTEGQADLAREFFEKAIENDDKCDVAWSWLAAVETDDSKKADYLNRVLELDPENGDATAELERINGDRTVANYYNVCADVVNNSWDDALVSLDAFLADNLDHTDAWILRSHISPNIQEKVLSFKRVLDIDPENSFAHASLKFFDGVNANAARSADAAKESSVAAEESGSFEPVEASIDSHEASVDDQPAADEPGSVSDENLQEDSAADVEFVAPEPSDEEIAISSAPTDESIDLDLEGASDPSVEEHYYEQASRSESPNEEPGVEELVTEPTVDPFESPAVDAFEGVQDNVVDFSSVSTTATEPVNESISDDAAAEFIAAYESRFAGEDLRDVSSLDTVEVNGGVDLPSGYALSEDQPSEEAIECPYCAASINSQAFSCRDCRAILSLSDFESILASNTGDLDRISEAVTEMEAAWNSREFSCLELKELGIGHLNLKNFERGLRYLQEASRIEPNDVILAGQVNALAIRLDEIRRQDEIHESQPTGRSILVVDDSATVRKLISNKLEKHGHTVVCAADGVEAMDAIETFLPELVLLDITMPRMDGYQVCKLIRSHEAAKDVPVVMISGKDGFFDKVRGRMSGCSGYITKPFGPETLMKALETYLVPTNSVVE